MSADYTTEHYRAYAHDGYLWIVPYHWDDYFKTWQVGDGFTLTVEEMRELQSLMDQWTAHQPTTVATPATAANTHNTGRTTR